MLPNFTEINTPMSIASYRKPQKYGLIKSLLFRCFSYIWKDILYKNGYTHNFVDKCIKEIFDLILTSKINLSKVPQKNLMLVLVYLGKLLLQT